MHTKQIESASTAHTPGPWLMKSIKSDGRLVYCFIGEPLSLEPVYRSGVAFAGTYAKRPRKGLPVIDGARIADLEALANARLIAAAPDLLAALQRCVREMDMVDTAGTDNEFNIVRADARAAIAKATT